MIASNNIISQIIIDIIGTKLRLTIKGICKGIKWSENNIKNIKSCLKKFSLLKNSIIEGYKNNSA